MPYGTDSFTDRYGDYKQPTILDFESKSLVAYNANISSEDLENHKNDIEETLKEILTYNPFLGGDRYMYLVKSVNNKLTWDVSKINELKSDSDWLFSLRKYLNKANNKFINNKLK